MLNNEKLHEECGLFGIYLNGEESIHAARCAYHTLTALQHRGQESAGIAVNDRGVFKYHRDIGLVSEVFSSEVIDSLEGQIAIGHVRYSPASASSKENSQPLVMRYAKGTLALAHNGMLTNAQAIIEDLSHNGAIFQTTSDAEAVAYLIARERLQSGSVELAIKNTMKVLHGAYSMLAMSPQKLIAFRDPHGFRPLCVGRIDNAYVFASESCAFDAIGAEFVRDVEPGEIIICDKNGIRSDTELCGQKTSRCIFEYIYFARSDSVIDGVSVYESRRAAGRELAKQSKVDADIVIGVPESGIDAAVGFSEESGIPYAKGIIKNSYIGRTFIRPAQSERINAVRLKLNALKSVIGGKRVVMLDDSIVRGTTMNRIVTMLREAGATEVHVRISSPLFLYPCYYGTDVPDAKDLIANNHSVEEICGIIGADSLDFLKLENVRCALCGKDFGVCTACFDGNFPDGIIDSVSKYEKHI